MQLSGDAVVNDANQGLVAGGVVADAIHRHLDADASASAKLREIRGALQGDVLPVGDAVYTPAGGITSARVAVPGRALARCGTAVNYTPANAWSRSLADSTP